MNGMRITKLERDEDGYWRARVTPESQETIQMTRRYGSWLAEYGGRLREPAALGLADAPVALQERVRRLEAREREQVAARRRAAASSGRVRAQPRDASRRASSAPIASLPLAGRARVRVRGQSPATSAR